MLRLENKHCCLWRGLSEVLCPEKWSWIQCHHVMIHCLYPSNTISTALTIRYHSCRWWEEQPFAVGSNPGSNGVHFSLSSSEYILEQHPLLHKEEMGHASQSPRKFPVQFSTSGRKPMGRSVHVKAPLEYLPVQQPWLHSLESSQDSPGCSENLGGLPMHVPLSNDGLEPETSRFTQRSSPLLLMLQHQARRQLGDTYELVIEDGSLR